jgi:hypothetical protein
MLSFLRGLHALGGKRFPRVNKKAQDRPSGRFDSAGSIAMTGKTGQARLTRDKWFDFMASAWRRLPSLRLAPERMRSARQRPAEF